MINNIVGLKTFSSVAAVEEDGTRAVMVTRSFRDRFFTLPWRPWVVKKEIQVTKYKPAIFQIGDIIFFHPSLEKQLIDLNGKE